MNIQAHLHPHSDQKFPVRRHRRASRMLSAGLRPHVSEDSAMNGKSTGSEGRPSFFRVDSPAMSTTSGGGTPDTRSPVSPSEMSFPPVTAWTASSVDAAVEAHRARELKWISAMSTTPPSQARKGKKIRKLLQEGVPALYGTRCGRTSRIVKRSASRDCMRSLGSEKRCRLLGKFRGTPRFVLREI
jgi:hypothetical protein